MTRFIVSHAKSAGLVTVPSRVRLADGDETLDVVAEIDDHALVHQTHNTARQLGTDGFTDTKPRIFLGLLESERDTLVFAVDVEDDNIHRVALLHDFRRMLDALGPGHLGDVNQAVDVRLRFRQTHRSW